MCLQLRQAGVGNAEFSTSLSVGHVLCVMSERTTEAQQVVSELVQTSACALWPCRKHEAIAITPPGQWQAANLLGDLALLR